MDFESIVSTSGQVLRMDIVQLSLYCGQVALGIALNSWVLWISTKNIFLKRHEMIVTAWIVFNSICVSFVLLSLVLKLIHGQSVVISLFVLFIRCSSIIILFRFKRIVGKRTGDVFSI